MTLIAFSGGCDSTLALYLESDGGSKPVKTISITHPQVCAATESERARRVILKKLNADRKPKLIKHTNVTLSQIGDFEADRGDGLAQPLIWLGIVINYLDKDEDLVFGYVRGDHVWHYKQHLCDAFYAFQRLGGRAGQLRLPLEHDEKADVIKQSKKLDLLICVGLVKPRPIRRAPRGSTVCLAGSAILVLCDAQLERGKHQDIQLYGSCARIYLPIDNWGVIYLRFLIGMCP